MDDVTWQGLGLQVIFFLIEDSIPKCLALFLIN